MPDPQDVLGRRIAAGLVDVALLFAVVFAVAAVPGLGEVTTADGSVNAQLSGLGIPVYAAVALGYYYVLEATTGRTLGKRLLGLRVVSETNEPPTSRAIAVRTLFRLVDALPVLYLVGFVTMLAARPRNRRIGDLVAKTMVVRG
jgi:uncharacterized RDD family membrane protein YckC